MKLLSIFASISSVAVFAVGNPIYKEIAHSLGYDYIQASNAGAAFNNGIRGIVSAVGSIDQFKPIIHPDVVSTINTVENYGGLAASIVGWVIKLVVEYIYTSDLLNDTPYIGELIRNADSMIKPEHASMLNSIQSNVAMATHSAN